MIIQIRTFGVAKEIVGAPTAAIELNGGSSVKDLMEALEARFPPFRQLASYRIAVNNEFAAPGQPVAAGDEVAIIPPVSGG